MGSKHLSTNKQDCGLFLSTLGYIVNDLSIFGGKQSWRRIMSYTAPVDNEVQRSVYAVIDNLSSLQL